MLPRVMGANARLERQALLSDGDSMEKGYGTGEHQGKNAGQSGRPGWLDPQDSTGLLPEVWMSWLDDDLPVSAISIPGTHDSAAFTYSWPFVATQNMSILEQLDAGIRYFDLRCGIRENIVEMVHGSTYLGLKFSDVLQTMYDWLDTHSSEGLVVQVKHDRQDSRTNINFAHAIANVIDQNGLRWRTANTTPTVGELRGRIQLFRRFHGHSLGSYGLNVTEWQDNPHTPFTIYTSHCTKITVQDHYSWPDPKGLPGLVAEKGGDVAGLLNRAADDLDIHHWYINFTSAYELNFYYQISPKEIALGGYWGFKWEVGMNVRLRNFLDEKTGRRRRYGIVAMDFPEAGVEDLILQVIMSNFEQKLSALWDILCFWLPLVMVLATVIALVILIMT